MTIIVGITTPDGIILASDSRMTRSLDDGYRILSDSSQKVFEDGGYGVVDGRDCFHRRSHDRRTHGSIPSSGDER
jgi:hypothetical protein